MRHFPDNPRRITKAQFERLQASMEEFGDLSGIVHNLEDDTIIGGNQRSEAGALLTQEPTITERYEPPLADGTVALGYFDFKGRRFAYRAVRWDFDKAQRANLVANVGGGTWDWDTLANYDSDLLQAVGFDSELALSFSEDSRALGDLLKALDHADGFASGSQFNDKYVVAIPLTADQFNDKALVARLIDGIKTLGFDASVRKS